MASALEQYVIQVMQLSSQGEFAQLCDYVSKNFDTLYKNASSLDTVLDTLDAEQHSVGALAVLIAKYHQLQQHPAGDFEALFSRTQRFINICNAEHIRYASDTFADLCHRLTACLLERKCAMRGILLLGTAIEKLQSTTAQLTSVHSDLCLLCLSSHNLKPALKYLTIEINDINREGGQYEAKHLMLYCYYGGMIFAALKMFDRALCMFETAVSVPAMAISHIMVESYKKYLLVSLLLHAADGGRQPTLPKYCSAVVNRFIKPICQPYHDLATAFGTNSPSEVRKMVEKHSDVYRRDNNFGLVKQCLIAIHKKSIQRLTKTFVTLSLVDVANRSQTVGPREAEQHVLQMIEDREIYALINQRDGMVEFHDNPEKYDNPGMMVTIQQEISKCIRMNEKIVEMEREVCVNPEYVRKVTVVSDNDASSAAAAASSSSSGSRGGGGHPGAKPPSLHGTVAGQFV